MLGAYSWTKRKKGRTSRGSGKSITKTKEEGPDLLKKEGSRVAREAFVPRGFFTRKGGNACTLIEKGQERQP